jgi:hypothetical protein
LSRISRRDKIILPEMWRQILSQTAYQLLVMLFLMYFGGLVFFEKPFNLITEPRRRDGVATDRLVLDTICFHTFMLMSFFN